MLYSTIKGSGHRIYYVRYLDSFLIGVNSTRTHTLVLKKLLKNFLSLNLELSIDKTKILSAIRSRANFLETEIRATKSRTNDRKNTKEIKARLPHGQINLFAPLKIIVKKLADQGICDIIDFRTRKIIPKRKTAWINLPMEDIVRKYNYL